MAHNHKVVGSNPTPATKKDFEGNFGVFFVFLIEALIKLPISFSKLPYKLILHSILELVHGRRKALPNHLIERSYSMSTQNHSAVAVQSKKIDKSIFAVAAIATATLGAVFAFSPATHALGFDNLNLGTGISTQDGDESSAAGVRLASQDGLENLGVGTAVQNTDGDEMQSAAVGLESTDDLENISANVNAASVDGDESNALGIGVATEDNLENVSTDVHATSVDGDESSNFGISFSFDE